MLYSIIMAAGKGTRMKSGTGKTMHKIMDKPIIEYICDTMEQLDCQRQVIVVGYDRENLMAHLGDRAEYAVQDLQHGTAHAVMQAQMLSGLEGKTLIINGDCPLVSAETYRQLIEAAQTHELVVLTTLLDDPGSYGRIIRDENGEVTAIVEKKDASREQLAVREVNAGIYCVDNRLLWQYLPEITDDNAQHEFYITDLVAIFRAHGHKVGGVAGDSEELQGINSRAELAKAARWLQSKINRHWMNEGVTIVDPETTWIGSDVTIGADTIIYPSVRLEGKTVIGENNTLEEGCYFNNAVIGRDNAIICCRITDSRVDDGNKIGPNAHLRNGCHIHSNCRIGNYVEMKNTDFGSGSKCADRTYIGDSTVGEKCNFGCGVVTVNYDGKNKFHTTIGNHCFIGSNVNIIAPVTIEDNSVLAAGSTITNDVAEGDMAIGRVRQENKPGYGSRYLNK